MSEDHFNIGVGAKRPCKPGCKPPCDVVDEDGFPYDRNDDDQSVVPRPRYCNGAPAKTDDKGAPLFAGCPVTPTGELFPSTTDGSPLIGIVDDDGVPYVFDETTGNFIVPKVDIPEIPDVPVLVRCDGTPFPVANNQVVVQDVKPMFWIGLARFDNPSGSINAFDSPGFPQSQGPPFTNGTADLSPITAGSHIDVTWKNETGCPVALMFAPDAQMTLAVQANENHPFGAQLVRVMIGPGVNIDGGGEVRSVDVPLMAATRINFPNGVFGQPAEDPIVIRTPVLPTNNPQVYGGYTVLPGQTAIIRCYVYYGVVGAPTWPFDTGFDGGFVAALRIYGQVL